MSNMKESKEDRKRKVVEEFRRRGATIPEKKPIPGKLDNGESGEFTKLWNWCKAELKKIDEEEETE